MVIQFNGIRINFNNVLYYQEKIDSYSNYSIYMKLISGESFNFISDKFKTQNTLKLIDDAIINNNPFLKI